MQDDDDTFGQLQVGKDEQVASFGVDVYQQVFPVGAATQVLVGDDVHPQQPPVAVVGILARVERMRQLHGEYLAAGQAWQECGAIRVSDLLGIVLLLNCQQWRPVQSLGARRLRSTALHR